MRYFFALLTYRLVFIILLPLVLVLLILRSRNNLAYRQRLSERLGFISKSFKKGGIIIHAASVGEVIALKSYINLLIQACPNTAITVTTFTPTGSEQVKKLFANTVQHCYLPIDCWPCSALFLQRLQPQAMVFMETELWPNLIAQCKQQNITLQLINARLSNKSIKSYQKLAWLITPSLQAFQQILTQSEQNQTNFTRLGAKQESTHNLGNIKYDINLSNAIKTKQQQLAKLLPQPRAIWLIASTHAGDEELILTSFKTLKRQHHELLLVIVPRHPERFDDIYQLCQQSGFNTLRRSSNEVITKDSDIWLLDSLGELLPACSLATIVTMGGSFSSIGGHNPLEPALFKKPIILGADMSNFAEVTAQLLTNHAVIQLPSASNISKQLTEQVGKLLADQKQQQQLGDNAYQVVQQNQGASQKSVNHLLALLT